MVYMDIEGYAKRALRKDPSNEAGIEVQLASRILEIKDISPERAHEIAAAVVCEAKATLNVEGDERATGTACAVGMTSALTCRDQTRIWALILTTGGAGGGMVARTALYF